MKPQERITPEQITALRPSEVFVFGSNYFGRHGLGAARTALQWGARQGVGEGLCGQTYALPTKGYNLRSRLPLPRIGEHVSSFLALAATHLTLTFLVTEIGCGLAGYRPDQIAPLFAAALPLDNVWLPASFWRVIRP